jgi:hypothetical protein
VKDVIDENFRVHLSRRHACRRDKFRSSIISSKLYCKRECDTTNKSSANFLLRYRNTYVDRDGISAESYPSHSISGPAIPAIEDKVAIRAPKRPKQTKRYLLADIPVKVTAHILSYLPIDDLLETKHLSLKWAEACGSQAIRGRVLVEHSQFNKFDENFWNWLDRIGTRTVITELALKLAADSSMKSCPTQLQRCFSGLRTLHLEAGPGPRLEPASGLFCKVLTASACCAGLDDLSVSAVLSDDLLNSVLALSCQLKRLVLVFMESELPFLRETADGTHFEITRDRYDRLVSIFEKHQESLECLSIRRKYESDYPDRDMFAGKRIGHYPEQGRFIQTLSRMSRLRTLEYPFFPQNVGVAFSSKVLESVNIQMTQRGNSPSPDSPIGDPLFHLKMLAELPNSLTTLSIEEYDCGPIPSADIAGAYYVTHISDWIMQGKFVKLEVLDIDPKFFRLDSLEFLPDAFFQCFPNIKELTLAGVYRWSELIPALLRNCGKLQKLDLYTDDTDIVTKFTRESIDESTDLFRLMWGDVKTRLHFSVVAKPSGDLIKAFEEFKRTK